MTQDSGQNPQGAADQDDAGQAPGQTGDGSPNADGQAPTGGTAQDARPQLDADAQAKELKRAREEAAASRKESKEVSRKLAAVLEALGGGKPDQATPEALADQVKALTKRLNRAEGRNAFNAAASAVGADAELVYAVLVAGGELEAVDYSDSKALQGLIKSAMKANPKLAAGDAKKVGAGTDPSSGQNAAADMNAWIRKQAGFS